MKQILALYQKYKEVILYVFWGGMTTLVNIVVYYLFYDIWHIANVPSTAIAWLVSMLFAFVTNKIWVFNSRNTDWITTLKELISFTGFRLLSGVCDVGIMYLGVDVMHGNGLLWKILANVIVVILNYIFSKFFIFKKKAD